MLSLFSFSWFVLINDNLVQQKRKHYFLSFGIFKRITRAKKQKLSPLSTISQDKTSTNRKNKIQHHAYEHSNYDLWENVPEIPMSYPNMRPLEAATMQVINTDTVILPLKSVPAPVTAKPPTGAIWFLLFLPLNFSGYKQNSQSKW